MNKYLCDMGCNEFRNEINRLMLQEIIFVFNSL